MGPKSLSFLLLPCLIASACAGGESRQKRTIYPFSRWGSGPPHVPSPMPPTPNNVPNPNYALPLGYAPQHLEYTNVPKPSVPNAKYPIFKVHKYNGVHIKPVGLADISPKIIKMPSAHPNPPTTRVEVIQSYLGTKNPSETLNAILDIASSKNGFQAFVNMANSGVLEQVTLEAGPDRPPAPIGIKTLPEGPQKYKPEVYAYPLVSQTKPIAYENAAIPSPPALPTSSRGGFSYEGPGHLIKSVPNPKPHNRLYPIPQSETHNIIPEKFNVPIVEHIPYPVMPEMPPLPDALELPQHYDPFPDKKKVVYESHTDNFIGNVDVERQQQHEYQPIVVPPPESFSYTQIERDGQATVYKASASENKETVVNTSGKPVEDVKEQKHENKKVENVEKVDENKKERKKWMPASKRQNDNNKTEVPKQE